MTPAEVKAALPYLTESERVELEALLTADIKQVVWRPLPGPQMLAYDSKADIVGYGGAAGGGKGLALTTPLATPTGWTTMGAVSVGDTLFDENGTPCAVTAVSEINRRPCYRLTFDDGSTLIADDVHRWVTFDVKELAALTRRDPDWRAARRATRPSRAKPTTSPARVAALAERNARCAVGRDAPTGTMRDTRTIANTLLHGKRRNHAVRVASAITTPETDLPVPPYVLGAWLGDGSSRNGQLTGEDAYIWERIRAEGFEVRHYEWNIQAHSVIGLKVKLADLGVLTNKHIPEAYLRASYDQRLALLQGLMDTDGHAALDGGCEFDNTNEVLARGVRQLVATLGIKSTMQQGTAKLNGRRVGDKWRVKFTTTLPVFGMPRKAERLKPTTRRTSAFRYIVACDEIETTPTKCIAVDSPSRQYLAGEQLIPTHNTDLAAGTILTHSERALFIRREKAQTAGVIQRITEILGTRDGYSSQHSSWTLPNDCLLELGGLDNPGDERRWQGRPHDKKLFDEVTEMREQQVRFIMGWTRTNNAALHAQVIMTFNPPTTTEGRWVIAFFAPWLDRTFPGKRALPGELRYAAMLPDGNGGAKDIWLERGDRFVLKDGEPCYEFDPADHSPEDIIKPKSRTFIPARLTDNPYYMATGYMSTLQALPEPLRSQMLYGDFTAGMEDDEWQAIPTKWVEAAQARWKPRSPKGEMLEMGLDVARGGKDNTVMAARHRDAEAGHDYWFDELKLAPGKETDDGDKAAAVALVRRRDDAPVNVDVIGVGAAAYDSLNRSLPFGGALGVNVATAATRRDQSGQLEFFNLRSQLVWAFRELLDPRNDTGAALPPDPALLQELCAFKWTLSGKTIKVCSREDVIELIGRSPDRATAVFLANVGTPKVKALRAARGEHHEYSENRDFGGHDPYA